ncbi:MAG TPA: hypothetical protein DCF68_00260, partial [Cyanothece sp. UBA12306]|nr:hypothetical protein [Cyanothece sp. UBA12306]
MNPNTTMTNIFLSRFSYFVGAIATLGVAGAAQAAIITVPPDLNGGDQYRLVFVTDALRNASS